MTSLGWRKPPPRRVGPAGGTGVSSCQPPSNAVLGQRNRRGACRRTNPARIKRGNLPGRTIQRYTAMKRIRRTLLKIDAHVSSCVCVCEFWISHKLQRCKIKHKHPWVWVFRNVPHLWKDNHVHSHQAVRWCHAVSPQLFFQSPATYLWWNWRWLIILIIVSISPIVIYHYHIIALIFL